MTEQSPQQRRRAEVPAICLGRREAAKAIGVSDETLDALIASGKLRSIRVGRRVLVRVRELEAWSERAQARRIA